MNRLIKLATAVGLMALLSGCATMDRSECLNADWQLIGYEDGLDGHSPSRIGDHRDACSDHNITPDLASYVKGHRLGLEKFCTNSNGYALGRRGRSFTPVCPDSSELEFLTGFENGQRVYQAEQSTRQLERQLSRHHSDIRSYKKSIKEKKIALVSDGISSGQRLNLLNDIENLEKKIRRLKKVALKTEDELVQERNHYQWLESKYGR